MLKGGIIVSKNGELKHGYQPRNPRISNGNKMGYRNLYRTRKTIQTPALNEGYQPISTADDQPPNKGTSVTKYKK